MASEILSGSLRVNSCCYRTYW